MEENKKTLRERITENAKSISLAVGLSIFGGGILSCAYNHSAKTFADSVPSSIYPEIRPVLRGRAYIYEINERYTNGELSLIDRDTLINIESNLINRIYISDPSIKNKIDSLPRLCNEIRSNADRNISNSIFFMFLGLPFLVYWSNEGKKG